MSTPANMVGAGSAASPRTNMLAPNIFDPRTDGSDYYWYVTNIGAGLAPGATTNSQVQIDAGTDFYWIATTYMADLAGAAITSGGQVIPLVTTLINDTGTSRNLMNNPIPLPSLAGDGKEPYRLPRPRLFRANSIVNFTWTSYTATATTTYSNLYFVMHGYRRLVQAPGQMTA